MKGTTTPLNLALIGLCAISIEAVLTEGELGTVLSSFKFFKIRRCILSSEITGETAKNALKKLNENFILTGFAQTEFLGDYVRVMEPPVVPTAVVIKTRASSQAKHVFIENSEKLFWFIWFLITNDDDLDPEIMIPYNCQLFQIKGESHGIYRLIESYHIKNYSNFREEFGFWTPQNGLTASSFHIYSRRTDMKGVQLNLTLCRRYEMEAEAENFWTDLARILNFSLKKEPRILKETPDGLISIQNPDCSTCLWGITGLDIEREWLFSTFGEKVKLTMKFRGTNEVGWRAYWQPFTREMWLALGVWLLLSTAAIIIVRGCTRETLYLNFFTSFYCLCNSDPMVTFPPNDPLPSPTKLVHLMVVAVPAFLVPAYSAYILSTLSIIRPLEPFNSLKGFIEDSTYRLMVVNNTFGLRYLKGSGDPEIKYIYNNLFVGTEQVPPTFRALFTELCKKHKLVGLFVESKALRREFQCEMFIVHQEAFSISTGFLLSKGSPLRKMLNERFLRTIEIPPPTYFILKHCWNSNSRLPQYRERGMKQKSRRYADPYPYELLQKGKEELNALNMSQMRAIFFLVPLGIILSLIVLAAELAVKKHRERISNEAFYKHDAGAINNGAQNHHPLRKVRKRYSDLIIISRISWGDKWPEKKVGVIK